MSAVTKIVMDAKRAWRDGTFQRRVSIDPDELARHAQLPQVRYESFMRARVVRGNVGDVGELHVEFDALSIEDNRLHIHPSSDRILTVLKGNGLFVAVRNNALGILRLSVGDQILMPCGVTHSLVSGPKGMTIRSVHAPFQGLDDPQVFRETDESVDLSGLVNGQLELPSLMP